MNTKELFQKAKELGCCELFHGNEIEDELLKLFLTTQGIEFCTNYNFPAMDDILKFDRLKCEANNIYINSKVSLSNEKRVVLVGNTVAELKYDDPDKGHEVILMHGAKATIRAYGYAVVFVTGEVATTKVFDHAKIL